MTKTSKRTQRTTRRGRQPVLGESHIVDKEACRVVLPRYNSLRTHTFNRNMQLQTITTSTSAESGYGFAFTLGQLRNASEFTNLYDYYRFVAVTITLIPAYTTAPTDAGGTNLAGYMLAAADYDDALVPTIDSLMQYSSRKLFPLGRVIQMVIKQPRTKVGSGAAGGNMLHPVDAWFDVADTDQPFYGLKIAFPQTNIIHTFTLSADVTVTFKGDR